jgi:hypothetical protein
LIRVGEDLIDRLATTGLPCHRVSLEMQAQKLKARFNGCELFSLREIVEEELGGMTQFRPRGVRGTFPCRGSGCPRAFLFFPQEWGIKGVDSQGWISAINHRSLEV